jgi:DNA replication and repair protein RecF
VHVTRLALRHFRSYAEAQVELAPGVTTLLGLNGQGKTNLVEAVEFLARQASHRVAHDTALIQAGHEQAVIAARVQWEQREQTVELEINAGRPNRARLAGAPRRPREVLGVVRTVLFAPEDLALVKGDPGVRRRFIDDLVVALTPRLAQLHSDYDRVVRQRSALLKTMARTRSADAAALAVWDDQLVSLGVDVAYERLLVLSRLAEPFAAAYHAVAGVAAEVTVGYESRWLVTPDPDRESMAAQFRAALAERNRAELERGVTLVGPQRDDIALSLGGLPAKGYASHGESWSVALALRLASFQLLREGWGTGGDPVLILDDVFAELDAGRRERLANLVVDAEQVLVTAAVEADVPPPLRGRVLSVRRDGDSEVSW